MNQKASFIVALSTQNLDTLLKMKTNTARYINISDLYDLQSSIISDEEDNFINVALESAGFTWGDADVTLITVKRFIDSIEDITVNDCFVKEEEKIEDLKTELIALITSSLGHDGYINLEG